jgi:PEP-CTERM motif-containing protein
MAIIPRSGLTVWSLVLAGAWLLALVPGSAYADVLVSRPSPSSVAIPVVYPHTGEHVAARDLLPGFEPYSTQAARVLSPGERRSSAAVRKSGPAPQLSWHQALLQRLVVELVVLAGIPQRFDPGKKQSSTPASTPVTPPPPATQPTNPPGGGSQGPGVTPTPEPASLLTGLIGLGVGGSAAWGRARSRKRRHSSLKRGTMA